MLNIFLDPDLDKAKEGITEETFQLLINMAKSRNVESGREKQEEIEPRLEYPEEPMEKMWINPQDVLNKN